MGNIASSEQRPVFNSDLLASGLSAVLGVEVIIAKSTRLQQAGMELLPTLSVDDVIAKSSRLQQSGMELLPTLSVDEVFGLSYNSDLPDSAECVNLYPIFVKTMTGSNILVQVADCFTIAKVKAIIEEEEGIPATKQKLNFKGKTLRNEDTVESVEIPRGGTIFLVLNFRGGGKPKVVLPLEELARKYDFDFTVLEDDGKTYFRGDYVYERPYGWYRYGLKVRNCDKYGSDNKWLGARGQRTGAATEGEWPVSYHGTQFRHAEGIIKSGLRSGPREKFGKGVYSTPSLKVAAKYAKRFEHEGRQHKIVFQNWVNPEDLEIIPATETKVGAPYWLCQKQDPDNLKFNIRPYGILIRQIDSNRKAS